MALTDALIDIFFSLSFVLIDGLKNHNPKIEMDSSSQNEFKYADEIIDR